VKTSALRDYLREVELNVQKGISTEHTFRSALESLVEALGEGVDATNEPTHVACGAPDFIVTRNGVPLGYIECKDVGKTLDEAERSEQLKRYRESLNNLILTDYLEFRWYVEGQRRDVARLANVGKGGEAAVTALFEAFFTQSVPTIGTPSELARRMAAQARLVRNLIERTFEQETEQGKLHEELKAFRETLIPDLDAKRFADMYAQTIAYGLFAARERARDGEPFTRQNAAWNLPPTNPFLRKMFHRIAGPELDQRIAWAVNDLAQLLERADMSEVLRGFGKATQRQDPVVHFYETFLAAYDPALRQRRGVYYTPEPVVTYIVHSIDYILRTQFDRPLGLADIGHDASKVYVLDPACGTGTFLYFVVQQIHETLVSMGQSGAWDRYVEQHLLLRLFGFELLMAPYAIAHLKLAMQLQESGYSFASGQRLGIYLTNALEQAAKRSEVLFARWITEEADEAAKIKAELPIMVVLGNPPYSVSSANKSPYIDQLMDPYKTAVRGERNIQPLSDDYIKFIRFAHDRIERTGQGIVGMITNHAYLSGLIHRGMREELMKSFSEIYILNLHGSALLGERTPDGAKDENVFDIRPGVAIALFVKKRGHKGPAHVQYADLWGLREQKYRYLLENDVSSTDDWQTLEPVSPYFFFVPKKLDLLGEYERGWSITDVLPVNSSGIKTHRDHFVIDFEMKRLQSRVAALRDQTLSDDEVRDTFRLPDTGTWKLAQARARLQARQYWDADFKPCLYRPFDIRAIYYSGDLIDRSRPEVMRHMLHDNVALLTMRRIRTETYNHFLVTKSIVGKDAVSIKDNCVIFPLYLYTAPEDTADTLFETEEVSREPNLSPKFIAAVTQNLGLGFVPDGKGNLETTFGPEDILHYAYAIFHSPIYRERYAELLNIDFPRLPLTSERALFKALAEKGEQLVALHLMESPLLNQLITRFPAVGSNEVVKVRYVEPRQDDRGNEVPGRVHINKTQYFEGIPLDVWEFHIGGYQVLHKWLKDRKGRILSFEDLFHYQKIVVALKETMRLMEEIDALIPAWPIH